MHNNPRLRKLLLSLTLAGLGTAAVIVSTALAFPPATQTQVACNGQICGGGSTLQYQWDVTPGNTGGGVVAVDIGTHSNFINAFNITAPPGWSFTLNAAQTSFRDHFPQTNHGVGATANGACPFVIHWFGPLQTAPFVLGFDNFLPPHDVTWKASDGVNSTFARPVGNGPGPVHSPLADI
jgi:hypothetical protein